MRFTLSRLRSASAKIAMAVTTAAATLVAVTVASPAAAAYTDPSAMTDAAFFAELNLDHPGLGAVRTRVQAGDYAGAKTELLAYYRARTSPVYFPAGTVPITAPLTSTPDDLVNYVFTWDDGQSRTFPVGDIDWAYHWSPSNPAEFGGPHYYVIDLIMTSSLVPAYNALPAGDPKRSVYADTWLKFALEFIRDMGNTNDGLGPEPDHVGSNRLDMAKRLTAWLSGFAAFRTDPVYDANANIALLKYAWQMADRLYATIEGTSGNNWYMSIARSIFSAGVYFPEFKDAANWRMRGEGATYKYMSRNVKNDGFNGETTENYHAYALALANNVMKLGAMNGYQVLAPLAQQLERGAETLAYMSLPNFEMPQIGDSSTVTPNNRQLLLDYAGYYHRPDIEWIASQGASGTRPTTTSVLHPNSYAAMRTDWSANDNYLLVENSDTSYAGSHNHPDDLSLVAYAYGKRLLVDPGVYDYATSGPGVWLRETTEAHNTVEVNNNPQANIERKHVSWRSNNGFDFYHGRHRDYAPIQHDRKVMFVKPGLWIVSDLMTGGSSGVTNAYEQLWHVPPTTLTTDATTRKVRTNFAGEANLTVLPADPSTVTMQVRKGNYSPQPNQVSEAPYVAYSKSAVGATSFDTVLYPEPAGVARNVSVTRIATGVAATTATALRIAPGDGTTGTYYLSHEATPATRSFGGLGFDGEVSYVERDAAGALVSVDLARGSLLTDGGVDLVRASAPVSDLSVKYQGTTLALSANDLLPGSVTVYAPAATAVTLNGAPVAFTRIGDHVTVTAPVPPITGTTVLTDAFDVGGLTSRTWTFESSSEGLVPEAGTWAVQGGTFRQTNPAQADARTLTASHWTDVLVQAKVTTVAANGSSTGVSLYARYQDANHHYQFRYYTGGGSNQLQIVKNFVGPSGPASTVLASTPFTMNHNTTYTLKAVATGNTLRLFVDGAAKLTAYDTDILIGSAGLGTQRRDASFDDLLVTEVADGDTWSVGRGYFLINNSELLADDASAADSLVLSRRQNDLVDVAASARVKVVSWASGARAGLTVRTLGTNDAYRFVVYNAGSERRLRIERVMGGLITQAAPVVLADKAFAFSTGTSYTFTAVARRGTLTFLVDGVAQLTARDPLLTRGGVGLYASTAQVRFDDVRLDTLG